MAEILWCCRIRGPDDVYAAPDYETALEWSDRFNDWLATLEKTKSDLYYQRPLRRHLELSMPLFRAAPAVWPWSDEAHAESLPKHLEKFAVGKLP